ncbi:MAG: hypothetical protein U0992_24775 [Planctomycetaceae bacterium]
MSEIEEIYRQRVDAMTVAEKFERMHALLYWARDLYARQLREELGDVSEERLKWEIALRQYGSDMRTRRLIEQRLQDVESRGVLSDAGTGGAGA